VPDTKISALTLTTSLSGAESVPIVQGGANFRTTVNDIAAMAGEGALTDNAVLDTHLRDSTALSVIGRSANSSGDPGDIIASADGYILRRSGGTVGFGTITVASVTGLAAVAASGSAGDLTTGTLAAARLPARIGDVTSPAGSVTMTLATVNSNVGAIGSATAIPVITVNAKGLITAVSTAALGTAAAKNLSVGTSAPASPATNDLWVDTN